MKKLKERWNLTSNRQLVVVFIVFAITGSVSARLAAPLTEWVGITKEMGWYLYWPIRLVIILPIYKVLLITFGWIFGEFTFFWWFLKKMLKGMGFKFLFKE